MALLTAAEILCAKDRQNESVEVSEWGGSVLVWEMTGSWRDRYELLLMGLAKEETRQSVENLRATLLAGSICDENGMPLFTEAQISALGSKNYKVLDRLKDVAERLNAISAEDKDALKNVSAETQESEGNGQ